MEDFKCHFDNFTTEMKNMEYKHFIETDRDYIDTKDYLNKLETRFDNIMNKLNEEEKEFLIEYIDKQTYKASCSSNELYLAGYKDCVKLLKEIGVI